MTKRYLLLLFAYVVPTFLLGFVWHLVLFDSYYKELGIYREHPIIPFGFGSMLIQAALFAWLYPRVVARPESLTDGVKFAAVGKRPLPRRSFRYPWRMLEYVAQRRHECRGREAIQFPECHASSPRAG